MLDSESTDVSFVGG